MLGSRPRSLLYLIGMYRYIRLPGEYGSCAAEKSISGRAKYAKKRQVSRA